MIRVQRTTYVGDHSVEVVMEIDDVEELSEQERQIIFGLVGDKATTEHNQEKESS
ncbi:hypothetical protein [Paenibacillus campi]|uniref:hypothetical protein n=1 Tax=Paenibacillus campi TaxID=3106031 RepID=UPI002AFF4492|nr:hypothetical protein [Paenibacillus sp. SGZ-1014]